MRKIVEKEGKKWLCDLKKNVKVQLPDDSNQKGNNLSDKQFKQLRDITNSYELFTHFNDLFPRNLVQIVSTERIAPVDDIVMSDGNYDWFYVEQKHLSDIKRTVEQNHMQLVKTNGNTFFIN